MKCTGYLPRFRTLVDEDTLVTKLVRVTTAWVAVGDFTSCVLVVTGNGFDDFPACVVSDNRVPADPPAVSNQGDNTGFAGIQTDHLPCDNTIGVVPAVFGITVKLDAVFCGGFRVVHLGDID